MILVKNEQIEIYLNGKIMEEQAQECCRSLPTLREDLKHC